MNTAMISDQVFDALRSAVRLAREESIRNVATLRKRLVEEGHEEDDAKAGIRLWVDREAEMQELYRRTT